MKLFQAALAVAVAALTVLGALSLSASPAHAAARVDVSTTPSADGSTTVTLSGSGFQYQPNAPGGIYVFFGAVSDPTTNAWAPSQGGKSGSTFSYASTSGSQLLIGFAGGASADSSNSMIDSSGRWSASMTIPGAKFPGSSGDPHSGNAQTGSEINCLRVQCGIITIGAHGSFNANNESFTPVGFVTSDGSVKSGTGAQSFTDDATVLEVPQADAGAQPEAETPEAAADPETADAGEGPLVDEGDQAAPLVEEAAATDSMTWWVLGVLGFAVLALIAALTLVIVKRVRTPKVEPQITQTETEGADAK